jgi:hypothetical protein
MDFFFIRWICSSGLFNIQADFNRMAQKVAAKQSPWIDTYNVLISNDYANPTWKPEQQA